MTPLEGLQQALAGEHAAVYVYGVLGGRVSQSTEPALAVQISTAYAVHRGRRDQLTSMVRAAKGDPVAAQVSYEMPNAAVTERQLRQSALVTERRCAAVYADLVGSTSRANRQWGIDALADAAVRQLAFGGSGEPYPGVDEL